MIAPLSRTERLAAGAIGAVKLLLSATAIFQLESGPFGLVPVLDEDTYLEWARRIAAGDWLGRGLFAQDPLYPYVLAVLSKLGGGMLAARVLNAGFAVTTLVLLFGFCRRTLGNRAALLAAAGFTLWGSLLLDEASIGKEPLVMLLCASVIAGIARAFETDRARAWAFCGVGAGLLALTRGNFLLMLPLVAIALAVTRPRRALLFAGGAALVLAGLSARNFAAAGDLTPVTSSSGFLLYVGNHPGASGAYEPPAFPHRALRFETEDYQREAERRVGHPLTPREASRYWQGEALAFIGSHPLEALRLFGRKSWLVFSQRVIPNNTSLFCMRELFVPVLSVAFLGFGWLWPLALGGAGVWLRERRPGRWLLLASAVYAGTVVLTLVVERYREPLAPAVASAAALLVDRAIQWVRERQWRSLAVAFAPVALSAPLVWWPLGGFGSPASELSQCTSLVGSALSDAGKVDEALPLLKYSVEQAPDPDAQYNLGLALQRAGDLAGAEAAYRAALAGRPSHLQAHFNLALLLLERGEGPGALSELEQARGLGPERTAGPTGAALELSGDHPAAIAALTEATRLAPGELAAWRLLAKIQAEQHRCEDLAETLRRAANAQVSLQAPPCGP